MLSRAQYKRPEKNIIVYDLINDKVIQTLGDLIRREGSRGLRIVLISESNSPKALDNIRDILLSNHAFTIEVYVIDKQQLEDAIDVSTSDLIVLNSNSEIARTLLEKYKNKVVVYNV